jgi:excinuclease ABC subunit A
LKNTLIVVEHDKDTIGQADNIIDIGPMAGALGGEVMFHGDYKSLLEDTKSLTADYISGRKKVFEKIEERANDENTEYIKIENVSTNNLKNVTVEFPLRKIVTVTGVSGSGKSSLVIDSLYPALANKKNIYAEYGNIIIPESITDAILVDQISIQGSIRSNLASYSKVFEKIRQNFAKTQTARLKGFTYNRFSFNNKEGRCNICEGKGIRKVAMHFLSDMEITCEACNGTRYNDETLLVRFKSLNIAEVLNLTVDEAIEFFDFDVSIKRVLTVMSEVGLSYIKLNQRLDTFSGGEKQRIIIAIAIALSPKLLIADEPTTALDATIQLQILNLMNELKDKLKDGFQIHLFFIFYCS